MGVASGARPNTRQWLLSGVPKKNKSEKHYYWAALDFVVAVRGRCMLRVPA
jgi:hypothetical protein